MAAAGSVGSCAPALPVTAFPAGASPLDPIAFFTGHAHSWGVLEDRSGQPTEVVTTDCTGQTDASGTLHMTQVLHVGQDAPQTRIWEMRRVAPGRYEATANDMVGTATGEAAGRAFHWQWTLALHPGNPFTNVTMDQWWYRMDDGSILNRTTVRKLGFIAAEVSEHFVHSD